MHTKVLSISLASMYMHYSVRKIEKKEKKFLSESLTRLLEIQVIPSSP